MSFLGGMRSMSFGVMPSFKEFEKAFDDELRGGKYRIRAGASGSGGDYEGSYTARELYDLVNEIKDEGDFDDQNSGMNFASSIMYSLGFEWN